MSEILMKLGFGFVIGVLLALLLGPLLAIVVESLGQVVEL